MKPSNANKLSIRNKPQHELMLSNSSENINSRKKRSDSNSPSSREWSQVMKDFNQSVRKASITNYSIENTDRFIEFNKKIIICQPHTQNTIQNSRRKIKNCQTKPQSVMSSCLINSSTALTKNKRNSTTAHLDETENCATTKNEDHQRKKSRSSSPLPDLELWLSTIKDFNEAVKKASISKYNANVNTSNRDVELIPEMHPITVQNTIDKKLASTNTNILSNRLRTSSLTSKFAPSKGSRKSTRCEKKATPNYLVPSEIDTSESMEVEPAQIKVTEKPEKIILPLNKRFTPNSFPITETSIINKKKNSITITIEPVEANKTIQTKKSESLKFIINSQIIEPTKTSQQKINGDTFLLPLTRTRNQRKAIDETLNVSLPLASSHKANVLISQPNASRSAAVKNCPKKKFVTSTPIPNKIKVHNNKKSFNSHDLEVKHDK